MPVTGKFISIWVAQGQIVIIIGNKNQNKESAGIPWAAKYVARKKEPLF
jgi:hypothetical protein